MSTRKYFDYRLFSARYIGYIVLIPLLSLVIYTCPAHTLSPHRPAEIRHQGEPSSGLYPRHEELGRPGLFAKQVFEMPSVFADSMILQRNAKIGLWGNSGPNVRIKALLNRNVSEAVTDSNGGWKIELSGVKAGGLYVLEVADQLGNKRFFNEILVGDVWLCAGQSKMHFTLEADRNGERKLAILKNPYISSFRCKMPAGAVNPESARHSKWLAAVGTNALDFLAGACYFAERIQLSQQIPIGIMVMSCRNTRAESWMPRRAIIEQPGLGDLNLYLSEYEGAQNIPLAHRPAIFYEATVKPLLPFKIKGVLWYQGESNVLPHDSSTSTWRRTSEYSVSLKQLISSWRTGLKQPDLPFYIVQLPSYQNPSSEPDWAMIRQGQLDADATKVLRHCGLVVTIDLGDGKDLHPADKRPVGERLAVLALSKINKQTKLAPSGRLLAGATTAARCVAEL